MNEQIKDQWITALRSGDYTQGQGMLRNPDDQFCCLGVLCDIAGTSGLGRWVKNTAGQYFFDGGWDSHDCVSGYLPVGVQHWAHLPTDPEAGDSLVNLNDHGMSFTQIADLIDKHL